MPSKTIKEVLIDFYGEQYCGRCEDYHGVMDEDKDGLIAALKDIEALCLEVIGEDVDTGTLEVGQVNLKDWINTTNSLRQQQRERLTSLLGKEHNNGQ